MLPVAAFSKPGNGLLLLSVSSALGTLAGGIMDVIQSQREFEEPVTAASLSVPTNEPGLRNVNLPLLSLRF